MQAQSSKLSFIAATFSDECSIDRFLPDFRAMVDLGNEIAKDRVFAGQNVFCFDAGIMSSLRLVCRLCREPKVWRDAIALMRRVGVRESQMTSHNIPCALRKERSGEMVAIAVYCGLWPNKS
jgi:hypothetical protein